MHADLTTEAARALPLDEYAEWMLRAGRYDVDTNTGEVRNPRSGQTLRGTRNTKGYVTVNLVFNRAVVRQVKVHRLVAIKLYGSTAVRAKQIAHLDGSTDNNTAGNLWVAPTAKAHVKYDGTDRNLRPRQPKKSWAPCVRCGDPDGRAIQRVTPDRITGARFGIEGQICRRCYGTLQERVRCARSRQSKACHADVLLEIAND